MKKNRNYKIVHGNIYEFARGGGAHGPKLVIHLARPAKFPHSEFVDYGLAVLDRTIYKTAHLRKSSKAPLFDLTEYTDDGSTTTSPLGSPGSPLPAKKPSFDQERRNRSLSPSKVSGATIKMLKYVAWNTFIFGMFAIGMSVLIYLFLLFFENAHYFAAWWRNGFAVLATNVTVVNG